MGRLPPGPGPAPALRSASLRFLRCPPPGDRRLPGPARRGSADPPPSPPPDSSALSLFHIEAFSAARPSAVKGGAAAYLFLQSLVLFFSPTFPCSRPRERRRWREGGGEREREPTALPRAALCPLPTGTRAEAATAAAPTRDLPPRPGLRSLRERDGKGKPPPRLGLKGGKQGVGALLRGSSPRRRGRGVIRDGKRCLPEGTGRRGGSEDRCRGGEAGGSTGLLSANGGATNRGREGQSGRG